MEFKIGDVVILNKEVIFDPSNREGFKESFWWRKLIDVPLTIKSIGHNIRVYENNFSYNKRWIIKNDFIKESEFEI